MSFQQGVGPERLPQGAATALNEGAPPAAEPIDISGTPLEQDDIPVVYAPDRDDDDLDSDDTDLDEDTQILAEAPDPNFRPAVVQERPGKLPKYIVRHLPHLMAAARQPDAPPTVRALRNAVIRQLERERRGL